MKLAMEAEAARERVDRWYSSPECSELTIVAIALAAEIYREIPDRARPVDVWVDGAWGHFWIKFTCPRSTFVASGVILELAGELCHRFSKEMRRRGRWTKQHRISPIVYLGPRLGNPYQERERLEWLYRVHGE